MSVQGDAVDDGWDDDLAGLDDDDDDFGDNDPSSNPVMPQQQQPPPQKQQHLQQPPPPPIFGQLKQYLEILPHLASSINALLEAEHNADPQKAMELVQYYQERPGLVDYTLEKELPRMEYIWMDPHTGEPITDKSMVHQYLLEAATAAHSLLPRCANQSLLADLLEILSSSSSTSSGGSTEADGLIRRQFHMAAQTQRVQFLLEPAAETVLVKAALTLHLPHFSRGMIQLATLHVSCQFAPNVPLWHYHIEAVLPNEETMALLLSSDQELLAVAQFLHELNDGMVGEDDENQQYAAQDGLKRDAFLQRTAANMWNQFKEATTTTLSNHLSLPSDDLLEQARREEEEAQEAAIREQQEIQQRRAMQQQQQQEMQQQQYHLQQQHQQQAPPPPVAHSRPPPPPPPPPPPQQQHNQQQEADRPQSILGGMFSRLAQSVTVLPHEDESMYEEWRQHQQEASQAQHGMPQWPGRPTHQPPAPPHSVPPPIIEHHGGAPPPQAPPPHGPPSMQPPPSPQHPPPAQEGQLKGGASPQTRPPPPPPPREGGPRHHHVPPSSQPQDSPFRGHLPLRPNPDDVKPPDHGGSSSPSRVKQVASPPHFSNKPAPVPPPPPPPQKEEQPMQPPPPPPLSPRTRRNADTTVAEGTDTNHDIDINDNDDDDKDQDGWDDDDLVLIDGYDEVEENPSADNDTNIPGTKTKAGDVEKDGGSQDKPQEHQLSSFPCSSGVDDENGIPPPTAKIEQAGPEGKATQPAPPPPPPPAVTDIVEKNNDKTTVEKDIEQGDIDQEETTAEEEEEEEEEDDSWYDAETDIIPTRQRWINPRPGPRQLAQLIAERLS